MTSDELDNIGAGIDRIEFKWADESDFDDMNEDGFVIPHSQREGARQPEPIANHTLQP